MGTNYYLEFEACPTCGKSDEPLHIGKSSGGWCFSLHIIPNGNIEDLADWMAVWSRPRRKIVDEYGGKISPAEMQKIITKRSSVREDNGFDYAANDAELGPNGLARSKVDGRHCIGHGKGTWDLITGEFC